MQKIIFFLSLMVFGSAQAALITLDFTTGSYSDRDIQGLYYDTYTQDGFTLTTQITANHLDPNIYVGNMAFHNGPENPTTDNNLILTYSGGAFDLTSIDFSGFRFNGTSLDLQGSNGATESITTIGLNSLSFLNVTSVNFSITGSSGVAGWDSLVVNTAPVPIPAALWLFVSGLAGFLGIRKRSPKTSALPG